MSIETIIQPQTETEKLFSDLDKPSLHALSYALRHPDTWPASFNWNYTSCDTCAMGLAHQLWRQIPPHSDGTNVNAGTSKMAKAFGMPFEVAQQIFFGYGGWAPRKDKTTGHLWWKKTFQVGDFKQVTPEMVAAQIDAYLARAE